ncbi:MAG TPA: efflux RND transporter permease subunit [Candidatus Saccharimonadales bacterium]|nr:efflux RND transporter permease subunit [Candidatus Saccharimonadales bacterium]
MSLPLLAVKRPITTVMILVTILVVGGIALARMPLAYLPEVDAPFIAVQIPYPNSNPTQVEKEITKPVEEVLATLSGVKKMRSSSTADDAQFFLEFTWGHDLDITRMQVSEKMDEIRPSLPAGIGQIVIFSFNTSDIPVVQARISAKGVDLSESYDLLESRIINPLKRVPGVARVDIGGVEPKEIGIDLVLDKIKEHRVDVGELIRRLQGTATNMVLGQVDQEGLRYTARVTGNFGSLDAIKSFPVDERGLKLSDIAEITYEEPPIGYGRHLDRDFAIALDVYKESTANTVETVRAVMNVINNEIGKDSLLEGIQVFVWDDQAEQITNGIDGLTKAGAVGGLLAILCLYFFLRRLDSTFIVSLSIPFSIVAACGIMYFMGKTLNILSMMGLMLGVGMLVDNAIVVLESIDRRHRDEPDRQKSALEGANQVVLAVTAATGTTLIVFLPLIVGASTALTTWLGEVGIAICLSLACSLFSSLTLIPLVSAHFLRKKKPVPVKSVAWLEDRYVSTLGWTLRHKVATLFILLAIVGGGIAPLFANMVKTAIFSGLVNKRLSLSCEFYDFHYKSEAEKVVDKIEAYLYAHKSDFYIDKVYSFFGENRAESTIVLSRQDLSDDEIKDLRKKIREGLPVIPGVRLRFDEDSETGGDSTFFAVNFFGQDAEVLRKLAEEMDRRLETMDGVQDVSTSFKNGRKEIQVAVDRDKALSMGLTPQDVSNIFSFTLGGVRLRRFNAGDKEVETWLSLRLKDRENLDDLRKIQFIGEGGRPVQLGDIANFQVVDRAESIERQDRKVHASVWATYEGKRKWGEEVRPEVEALANSLDMPPGYSWSWNDRILEQDEQSAQMGQNFLLALVLVYLVMAALFESLAQPFAILVSILFALPGATLALALTGTPLNLMAQIGLLILMGIVVNNGIVLLDRVNQYRHMGLGKEESILKAGRDRLRPILMTASTTIIGLAPLALGGSSVGDLFYFPMARTVMGGLASSSILTLLALPYISLGVEAVAEWLKRLWRLSRPGVAPEVAGVAGAVPAPTHPAP